MLHQARQIKRLARGLLFYPEHSNQTLAFQLESHARGRGQQPFLRFEGRSFTYREANALINQHAHAYRSVGICKGDAVALMMDNRPEFLWHVFGLHKIGAVSSLINTNLQGEPLSHAFRACSPRALVVGAEHAAAVRELPGLPELPEGRAWVDHEHGRAGERRPCESGLRLLPFAEARQGASTADPAESSHHQLTDVAAYIYTSGTTGLPKAAIIRHGRFYRAGAIWASLALRYAPGDVIYNCLPLYHSNGLMLGVGSALSAGVTVALARRFSRSRFWDDVRSHGATSFIYIGELCRYLVKAEPTARDRDHTIRCISGNGLRRDVWLELRDRFGIPVVSEFYGATEGNCITVNLFNIVGSVGPMLPNMALVRWDDTAQDFVRDSAGHLVKVHPGEAGVLLGRLRGRSGEFDGYNDRAATEAKIVHDAFAPGDAYFNTGDLLRVDRLHHLHFVDRLGDTFRWKGENTSTTEVQEAIATWPPVQEVSAYGVHVPHTEGRAGMVSLVLPPGTAFDPEGFKRHVDRCLPAYARPLFVRVATALEVTGTFKLRKASLQKEGFDPAQIDDPLFFRDPARGEYVPLDAELHARLTAGEFRV